MASPKIDPERVARIVADADIMGEESAANRHGVSVRTIYNYRKRAAKDAAVAEAYKSKKSLINEKLDNDWSASLDRALCTTVSKIDELVAKATLENLRDVVGACKILGELKITKDALSDEQPGADRQGGTPSPNGSPEAPASEGPAVRRVA